MDQYIQITPMTTFAPKPQTETVKISARDVCVFYGEKQALFDVSIDIPKNSVTAFIGPSVAESPRFCAPSTA